MSTKFSRSFRVTTLGPPALQAMDGTRIPLEDKRLALVLFLLLAAPRGFRRRDSILPIFWPELGQESARHALRQALYVLRSALGSGTIVAKGREEVGVRHERFRCDALEFERSLEEGDLAAALEIYRGDFLAGFHIEGTSREFEDWLESRRAFLRKRALAAFRICAGRLESEGHVLDAVQLLRRAHEMDRCDESIVRQLIRLLDRQGDRRGAIELYESFATLVKKEYAAAPSPETRTLVADVRHRESEAAGPRRRPPSPPTSLVGRELEIDEVLTLLQRDDVRWVTLTGTPGVGKTRVAIEAAGGWGNEVRGEVVFASLAAVRDPDRVLQAIAQALGLSSTDESSHERIVDAIGMERVLLLVDNLEHLLASAPSIARLLEEAPNLKVLATSRSPVHVQAERELPIPVLSLPDAQLPAVPDLVASAEAVQLFVARAVAARPAFQLDQNNAAAIAEICRRLDGLPLAIELAAARIRVLSPRAIAGRLEERFALLREGPRDVPHRQRCLASTIAWSYNLLSNEERSVLSCIALFPAGCDLKVLDELWRGETGEDALELASSLVEKSLMVAYEAVAGEPRFTMLESVREFVLRSNGDPESAQWNQRYVAFWVEWAEDGTQHYCTAEQPERLRRLDVEHDNLRAALRHAFTLGDIERAARLSSAIWWFWWTRGFMSEGRAWLREILSSGAEISPQVRAKALQGAGNLARGQGDSNEGVQFLEESLVIYRAVGDPVRVCMALRNLGLAKQELGDVDRAAELFAETLDLSRRLDHGPGTAAALDSLGTIAIEKGNISRARRLFEESLVLARRSADDHRTAHALLKLGSVAERDQDFERAAALYERSLAHYRELNEAFGIADSLMSIGHLARRNGAFEKARELYAEAVGLYRETGHSGGIAGTLIGFAGLNLAMDRADRTAQLCGGIEALVEGSVAPLEAASREELTTIMRNARQQLGDEEFRGLWLLGQAMSLEETIVLALQLAPAGRLSPTVKTVRSG